jgi:hypothetical protein
MTTPLKNSERLSVTDRNLGRLHDIEDNDMHPTQASLNPEWERCELCGNRCPEDEGICGACAAGNGQIEDAVNDVRAE